MEFCRPEHLSLSFLLQEIFTTQGLNPGFPLCMWILYMSHQWSQVSHQWSQWSHQWATSEAKNTGMGSLSLLQQISPTQELNHSLLHCRRILYQLSYQGSPDLRKKAIYNDCFALLDTWTSTISYKILAPSTHQLLGHQGSSLQICRKLFSITYMVLFFGI